MYIYLQPSSILHSILASVLCKKWNNIVSNSMLRGIGAVLLWHWHFKVRIHRVLFDGKYDFIFLSTKSSAVGLFHEYNIKLMTCSARKQYYVSIWAFSQFKSMYILKKALRKTKVQYKVSMIFNWKQSSPRALFSQSVAMKKIKMMKSHFNLLQQIGILVTDTIF